MSFVYRNSSIIGKITILVCMLFLTVFTNSNAAETIRIGVLLDGPIKREYVPLDQIISEIRDLNKDDFNVEFPDNKIKHGNWQVAQIRDELLNLLSDPNIDVIITNGILGSQQAAQIKNLNKPVIAAIVADRVLQRLPYTESGVSGKDNYVYISDDRTVGNDLRKFHELVQFGHLGIIVDKLFLDSLPELANITEGAQNELGFKLTFIPVTNNLGSALNEMPSDIDAMYVPPLLRFGSDEFQQFTQKLIALKMPSYSLMGRDELEMGILATSSGRDRDTIRYARRIALLTQSILLGENAANLKVALAQPEKLAINMQTARAINFSPNWRFLETADLLHEDSFENQSLLTLTEAIEEAVASNLSLQVDRLDLELAKDSVTNSRSTLLPQLNIGTDITQIGEDQAELQGSERSSNGSLNLSQTIYSESRRSGHAVAKLLQQAEDANLQSSILNIVSSTATSYLQLLSAEATEEVRKSNVKVTETNLELAESRLRIGSSDRSEVLRWRSQIATDRRNLYSAEASREQAGINLKQLIHKPLSEPIGVTDDGIANQLSILESEKFTRFFDNPRSFNIFTEFEVERAIDNAPELISSDHLIASNKRELKAAKRSYYVPDVNLNARYGENFDRSGTGSNNSLLLDDEWSVGIEASLPIFTGGALKSEVSRTRNTLLQNEYNNKNLQEQIETRVRNSLKQAKGSYPAIRLANDAAQAAEENLSLVIDSYSQGAVSITDLIDAQDASLEANLAAVNAQYQFMIDWIEVQRATANFDVLLEPDGFENWYQALNEYYATK
ncbi:MAG: hypothetical protein GKR92_11255 [Gammaproteobacteria bacterium]|nr:MAG: hypothetical protein GKR92_11255 [Gammaproteobacteria bacterium]